MFKEAQLKCFFLGQRISVIQVPLYNTCLSLSTNYATNYIPIVNFILTNENKIKQKLESTTSSSFTTIVELLKKITDFKTTDFKESYYGIKRPNYLKLDDTHDIKISDFYKFIKDTTKDTTVLYTENFISTKNNVASVLSNSIATIMSIQDVQTDQRQNNGLHKIMNEFYTSLQLPTYNFTIDAIDDIDTIDIITSYMNSQNEKYNEKEKEIKKINEAYDKVKKIVEYHNNIVTSNITLKSGKIGNKSLSEKELVFYHKQITDFNQELLIKLLSLSSDEISSVKKILKIIIENNIKNEDKETYQNYVNEFDKNLGGDEINKKLLLFKPRSDNKQLQDSALLLLHTDYLETLFSLNDKSFLQNNEQLKTYLKINDLVKIIQTPFKEEEIKRVSDKRKNIIVAMLFSIIHYINACIISTLSELRKKFTISSNDLDKIIKSIIEIEIEIEKETKKNKYLKYKNKYIKYKNQLNKLLLF
jgi:hypothetical protein